MMTTTNTTTKSSNNKKTKKKKKMSKIIETKTNENENEEKVKAQRDGTADLTAAEVLGVHALSVARSCSANSPFAEAM